MQIRVSIRFLTVKTKSRWSCAAISYRPVLSAASSTVTLRREVPWRSLGRAPHRTQPFCSQPSLCEKLVAPGGHIANIGVHGKPSTLHLERLWDRNITITTRLVDTVSTPMLLKTVRAHTIDPKRLITDRFEFSDLIGAYDNFASAAETGALKVLIGV